MAKILDDRVSAWINQSRLMLTDSEADAFARAQIGVTYWLDCSPHEQTRDDAIAMAKFIRMIAPRIGTPITDDDFNENGELKSHKGGFADGGLRR